MSKYYVRRVDQLDAILLDDELYSLLNLHYRKAFKYFPNSLLVRFGPEIDILFKFLYRYLPLETLRCTFGQNLFHLKYRKHPSYEDASDSKLRLLAVISVCFPWFWNRLIKKFIYLLNTTYSRKALDTSYTLESKFSTFYQCLTLLNFCIFLQKSLFPTVIERILCIRPVYSIPQEIHFIYNDNISRELLWHGLAELLGFALPLINVHKIKGFIKRTFLLRYYRSCYKKQVAESKFCSLCGEIPNFPHTFGCYHVFCYYCIASILLADPSYLCIECDITANGLDSLQPLAVNTLELIRL